MQLDPVTLAAMIDHTLLRPEATAAQVALLCEQARQYRFASVCINPAYVKLCAQSLHGSDVKVCTVIGFPLGATLPQVKGDETQQVLGEGAAEVDMVINVGALKNGDDALVLSDMGAVVRAAREAGALVKVIIETALLTNEEKVRACQLAQQAGADFVKTSTGFGPGGATPADVALIRRVVGPSMGVKASGGVKTLQDVQKMVEAGATRIGASASVKIMQEMAAARLNVDYG